VTAKASALFRKVRRAWERIPHQRPILPFINGANLMTDFIYVALIAGTFIIGGFYTVFCGKL
jgi:hypothetical protein